MNNKLPYEQQLEDQLVDLPLPDENAAWEDMRQRLEEDDDRIIPFWLRGCGLWSLVGIIILAISWWIIRPEKFWSKKQEVENTTPDSYRDKNQKETGNKDQIINPGDSSGNGIYSNDKKNNQTNPTDGTKEDSLGIISSKNENNKDQGVKQKESNPSQPNNKGVNKKTIKHSKDKTAAVKKDIKKNRPVVNQRKQVIKNENPVIIAQEKTKKDISENKPEEKSNKMGNIVQDSVPVKNNATEAIDSAKSLKPDSVKKKELEIVAKINEVKRDSTKKEKIFFSAGLGLQQQIPINGQKLVPYSSLGRNNILADYIPSVYFQANKPGKWFANIGFRYGAPQYNKEFTYGQDIKTDTSGQNITTTTTSLSLKKSFYHQLPVSFNYYILPNWSAGAGVVWNKFYGAVADQEVLRQRGSMDSIISKETILFKEDSTSSFSTSYFQALIQTEYNWKRFYFGVRYSFGLEPYIKFTLPGGTQQKERNSSLQVFIRYDLWRQKKK